MKFCPILVVSLAVVAGGGCKESNSTPAPAAPVDPSVPTQAQPKLQTLKLWLGAEEMTTELALTPKQLQTGMMFRTNMAENEGMLFLLGVPQRASFWMKNTVVPLSAAYIDLDGAIVEIHDLQPLNTNSVTAGSDKILYVLETKQGWFQRHNIGPGAVIRTERGSLRETLFRSR